MCRRFVTLCRKLKLFSQPLVAIDGSKFKAVNTRDRNFTEGKVGKRQKQIEESIQRYLNALETADRTQPAELEAKNDKIARLREQMRNLDQIKQQLKTKPDGQLSMTDPDARPMVTSGKGSGMVGYNVQAAVDAKYHLIVAQGVTNSGSDRAQLSPWQKLRATQWVRPDCGQSRIVAITVDLRSRNAPMRGLPYARTRLASCPRHRLAASAHSLALRL
ncbi:Mobile element protein [Caballeronia sordidicola]|uniref:Mobile element protein n=1 Tax=Caballeronia sordidicola TaxID=196367 RepID=A0A242MSI2_CABSO|nr:Mobile element protein [Caballeronia sordidicola]